MERMNTEQIERFLNQYDYDVRKTKFGRWIDQKCTPDVVWTIADFVLNYYENNGRTASFTVSDIWMSDYAINIVKEEFAKPDVTSAKVRNEFDKFFSQPLNLLCYSGIIRDISTSSRHLYVVNNYELLDYVATNDSCCYRFLCLYVEKVLHDSGLWPAFERFFEVQTKESYYVLKTTFEYFCYNNTNIRNKKETSRIFTKVLNPLACKYRKCGTQRGRLSKYIIPKQELMYNRDNFRDIYMDKPKGVSRKEWIKQNKIQINYGVIEHQMLVAKRLVRKINDLFRGGISELTQFSGEHIDDAPATQIHHIFPKNEFPLIQHCLENLIALTPNQYFGYAHPNNDTHYIDLEAQKVLLIAKTLSIKENLENSTEVPIYSFDNLLLVLGEGWNDDNVLDIEENDYADVVQTINVHYSDDCLYDEDREASLPLKVAETDT